MTEAFISSVFSKLDKNGDGDITTAELSAAFKLFDKDGNGDIDKGEFEAGFKDVFGGTVDQANKVFSKIDDDGSGEITISEINNFFKKMDADGSGEVSKDEFIAFWKKIAWLRLDYILTKLQQQRLSLCL